MLEPLLLVLGQKYLAQLKKQARALHEAQREASSVHGNAVDVSPAVGENGEDEDATAMLVSSSAVLPSSAAAQDDDADSVPSSPSSSSRAADSGNGDEEVSEVSKRAFSDTLTVDADSASQSLEPGKRVKVMACSESDSDAGKLLLGFFNTVNKKKAMRQTTEDGIKADAVRKLAQLPLNGNGRQVGRHYSCAVLSRCIPIELTRVFFVCCRRVGVGGGRQQDNTQFFEEATGA